MQSKYYYLGLLLPTSHLVSDHTCVSTGIRDEPLSIDRRCHTFASHFLSTMSQHGRSARKTRQVQGPPAEPWHLEPGRRRCCLQTKEGELNLSGKCALELHDLHLVTAVSGTIFILGKIKLINVCVYTSFKKSLQCHS